MITKDNFEQVLNYLGFTKYDSSKSWTKIYNNYQLTAKINSLGNFEFIYPEEVELDRETTQDDHQKESYVVFACVAQLFDLGYQPKQFKLEAKNYAGTDKGFCDILISKVEENQDTNIVTKTSFLIIECKTEDLQNDNTDEFRKHWDKTKKNGDQLFRYFNTYRRAEYLCLYSCDWFGDKLVNTYNLISLIDNKEYLKSDKKLKSFEELRANQGTSNEFFDVWKNTYKQDYVNSGLLEQGNEPFQIGKKKFSLSDLKEIDSSSMQKKYNDFATILRQHNVSGKENAFDKLVNYFLAKIIDETDNTNELECIWKGAANDDYFQLQDRLQKNYRAGMKRFFDDEVSYVGDDKIEDAFTFLNNRADESKRLIKKYFNTLKYYNNNPFAFIDVHNEELFFQNAAVLTEIVKLLQDIKLKTVDKEQNQFLGDLFEGYLDQGVKQSEGQFFTPMPIVKFLISSLPLENIVENAVATDLPKAIDYACGAGHFLTELAAQIKAICEKKNTIIKPEDFFKNIIGIEKEYRLSKVSQVSAFMYGLDGIKILYADALAETDKTKERVKNNSFSILVANPPYSVKGFLETLSEDDRDKFEIFDNKINLAKNDSIETFFVERAAQLLKSEGVAAIILPQSVLDNTQDYIYVQCREVLLKKFDIVAIALFGAGTFGKTTTRTATLYLRRKTSEPDYAATCEDRINNWFSGVFDNDNVYNEPDILSKYCLHINVSLEDYKQLLTSNTEYETTLEKYDIFKDYFKSFYSDTVAREIKKRIEKAKNKPLKGKYTQETKEQEIKDLELRLQKYVFDSVCSREKDKLKFFMLTLNNPQPVLIVKGPDDNKANKMFLGYEWSSAKGNEGIKYIGANISKDDEDNNLSNNKGIKSIKTPLFDPNDLSDNIEKINHYIRQNFNGYQLEISGDLKEYLQYVNLVDMLDFSNVKFEKKINTSVDKKIEIVSKYPLVKLGDYVNIIRGVTYDKESQVLTETQNAILTAENITLDGYFQITKKVFLNNDVKLDASKQLKKTDCFMCFSSGSKQHVGKLTFIKEDTNYYAGGFMGILRQKNPNLLNYYLFNLLNTDSMREIVRSNSSGSNILNLSNSIKEVKIPLPPIDIQHQIVSECEKIDEEYENSHKKVDEYKNAISDLLQTLDGDNRKLKDIAPYSSSRVQYSQINPDSYVTTDNLLQNCEGMKLYETTPNLVSVVRYQQGDILVSNIRPYLKKIWYADREGGCSPDVLVFRPIEDIDSCFVYYSMKQDSFFDYMMQGTKGMKMPRGDKNNIPNYEITVPPLAEQQRIVSEIETYEAEITKAKAIMSGCAERKKKILDKYLN